MTIPTVLPNTGLDKVKESAKAYAGLVGALVTSLAVVVVDGPAAYVLAILGAAATGVSVWATRNEESAEQVQHKLDLLHAELPRDEYPDGYAATVRAETPEGDPDEV